ncbi:MAG: TrkH family potassium uptake protein [Moorellales bacterium]
MDYAVLAGVLGRVLVAVSVSLLLPLATALYYREAWFPFGCTLLIGLAAGLVLVRLGRKAGEIYRREGYYIVALAWIGVSLLGSLPYLLAGTFTAFVDAFFETVSGFTTTGASVMTDVEVHGRAILLWRSLTQWLGGMGIVVLTLALLSLVKAGGLHILQAEVPGPRIERLKPKMADTARLLWLLYTLISAAEIISLWSAGMPFYDAVVHSFTTMATGGFSPKNASIGFYPTPLIHWLVILFMFLAGTNFALYYTALRRRRASVFWSDPEFRFYCLLLLAAGSAVSLELYIKGLYAGEELFRKAFFQVVSVMTTTGFATADFDHWPSFSRHLLLLLMFVGGCYGSTGGAIKVGRILLLAKHTLLELRRIVHPRAVLRVTWGREQAVPNEVVVSVLNFVGLYALAAGAGVAGLSALAGSDLDTSVSAVAATLGNVGPGLGAVGPTQNYAHLPAAAKYLLCFLMLFGRLEIYPLLCLFHRQGWSR